jgi:hypothetical protein
MKKKLIVFLLTFCCTFPVFGVEIAGVGDRNQLQLEAHVNNEDDDNNNMNNEGMVMFPVDWDGPVDINDVDPFDLLTAIVFGVYVCERFVRKVTQKVFMLIDKCKKSKEYREELELKQFELMEAQEQFEENQSIVERMYHTLWDVYEFVLNGYRKPLERISPGFEAQSENGRTFRREDNPKRFADKAYAEWKERTKYALVEYEAAEEQNNFNLQRDYSIQ